jgi:phosphoenolpyruvate carboxylase
MEFAWAHDAIVNARGALERLHRVVLEVAQALYPGRWTVLVPGIISVASWVGYDHDGRSDIGWADTLRMHLRAKLALLRRQREQAARLRDEFPQSPAAASLAELDGLLAAAVAQVERQIQQSAGIGADRPAEAAAFARRLVEGRGEALTDTGPLRTLLRRAIDEAGGDVLALRLGVLDAALARHGLTMAHPHFRINAAQIHNAIRDQVGLETAPTDPGRRRSYVNAVNDLLESVQPHTVNLGTIMGERASARRMFMMIAELAKHIDGEAPVRFLIAETESAFTLLSALYFARLFGIEQLVEITPLLETEDALRRGDTIIAEALKSDAFRGYVTRMGRICVQFGHSDSGRYVGQMAATFLIERLRLRIATVLARAGMRGIQVVLFDTHGESIGRGGHPVSMVDRLRYLDTPASRLAFQRAGMTLKQEVSFQGGDGYLPFLDPALAFAVVCRAVEAVLSPDSAEADDPIYREEDFAAEFFAVVRQEFADVVADDDYAALLGVLGANLVDKTGSRPTKRQDDATAARPGITHPSQLRAITNNAILQQLGFMANTITGVGRAAANDPEQFRFAAGSSPRFRRALAMVRAALSFSDPDVLGAYIDTLDPGMWLIRSGRNPTHRAALRAISHLLEPHDIHASLARIRRRFHADFLLLREALEDAGAVAADVPVETEELALLHAIRVALIHRIYLLATRIPDFTPQDGMTRADALRRLLHLDVEDTVATLREVFPRRQTLDGTDFAEPASYRSDASRTYEREHETILDPIEAHFDLLRCIGAALTHHIGAVG